MTGRGAGSAGRHFAGRPRWWSSLGSAWLFVLVLVAAVPVAIVLATGSSSSHPAGPKSVVVASVPYWSFDTGTSLLVDNRQDVNELSPWIYGLNGDGQIVEQFPQGHSSAKGLKAMRELKKPLVPTIANVSGGGWSYQPFGSILHSPSRLQEHVNDIVSLVRDSDYAGVDIDYENLRGSDRSAFTGFLSTLAAALHKDGRTLSVAVFAKTTDVGYDQRNVAQDYAAIGRVADEVRLMGYDYHWTTSGPGPIGPVDWIRGVLKYATSQIPAHKIVLGVPFYGYDWVGHKGRTVTWNAATDLARQHGATVHFDATSQCPWFAYTAADGSKHTVWFENTASTSAKLRAAKQQGIRGVFLWMFGGPEGSTWAALRNAYPVDTEGLSS